MKLLYWKPIITGSGVKYEAPVEFKGFYIGNAAFGDGGISDMVASRFDKRDNLVLFYLCKPEVDGYVSWKNTLAELTEEGLAELPPSELKDTHLIKSVTVLTMLGSKSTTLENSAYIVSVV